MIFVKTYYVARSKLSGTYALEGHETGMGRSIVSTSDISCARLCTSVIGMMRWMGGHYRSYEAVPVTVTYELGEVVPFPPETEAFPEDHYEHE